MSYRTVAVSHRPELAPLVARWRVNALFDHPGGYTVEEMTALILAPPVGPEETFVLFARDQPAGTAALVRTHLETRPDLTPWLAGLFVEPAFRGRGYGAALVREVEAFALAASVPILWLYTSTAEPFYLRLGWQRVGVEQENGHAVVLMRRSLFRRLPSVRVGPLASGRSGATWNRAADPSPRDRGTAPERPPRRRNQPEARKGGREPRHRDVRGSEGA